MEELAVKTACIAYLLPTWQRKLSSKAKPDSHEEVQMSVSLYRWAEKCEGRYCPGDCDYCYFDPEYDEEEGNEETDKNR